MLVLVVWFSHFLMNFFISLSIFIGLTILFANFELISAHWCTKPWGRTWFKKLGNLPDARIMQVMEGSSNSTISSHSNVEYVLAMVSWSIWLSNFQSCSSYDLLQSIEVIKWHDWSHVPPQSTPLQSVTFVKWKNKSFNESFGLWIFFWWITLSVCKCNLYLKTAPTSILLL